jgi:NAD(P)-dependent dehydrogenase (short-subunit alcohol dehydrogenase family)
MNPTNGARVDADRLPPLHDPDGKVAFITGGDSGIGLGIARAFAGAGMKVIITYRSPEHRDEALAALDAPGRVHAMALDVTDRAAVRATAAAAIDVFGKVHVLVNNAGVGPIIPLSCATPQDWDWCMNTNVNGVFNGIHAFLPHLKAHGEGSQIVATSSMLGGLVVGPFWGLYSTSKFAVVGMMEALRSELAETNIGVSVFCPAGVKTNLGDSQRNRPAILAPSGASDPTALAMMQDFAQALGKLRADNAEPPMDPLEAGQRVLQGIRNNDLYIISHAEHAQTVRERGEALLASIPIDPAASTPTRLAIARIMRTRIYSDEIKRRAAQRSSR